MRLVTLAGTSSRSLELMTAFVASCLKRSETRYQPPGIAASILPGSKRPRERERMCVCVRERKHARSSGASGVGAYPSSGREDFSSFPPAAEEKKNSPLRPLCSPLVTSTSRPSTAEPRTRDGGAAVPAPAGCCIGARWPPSPSGRGRGRALPGPLRDFVRTLFCWNGEMQKNGDTDEVLWEGKKVLPPSHAHNTRLTSGTRQRAPRAPTRDSP